MLFMHAYGTVENTAVSNGDNASTNNAICLYMHNKN